MNVIFKGMCLLTIPLFLSPYLCTAQSMEMPGDSLSANLDAIASDMAAADPAPGISVAVVMAGDTLLMKGYGYADMENEVSATARTIYRIGSITKQFTAAAIMHLVEEGEISLDDKLSKYIPDYPSPGGDVTIHQLLNHTSGIHSYTNIEYPKNSILNLSHDDLISLFKDKPLDFESGEKWSYNNSGYYLLGMVIEKATGDNYEDYLAETFSEPLALKSTIYCDDRRIVKNRASGYGMQEGEVVNAMYLNMKYPFAGGALCSTVEDLLKWTSSLTEPDILSTQSYEKMISPTILSDGSSQEYGYGLFVGKLDGITMISHGGGINGFATHLSYYPDYDLTITVLANNAASNPAKIEHKLARTALGLPEPTYEEIEIDIENLKQYVGVYEISPELKITVSVESGKLMTQGTGQDAIQIFPYENDKFFLKVFEAQISFNRDEKELVESMTLHQKGMNIRGPKIE